VHGHPFPGPLQLWWGKDQPAERPRNLFSSSDEEMPPVSDRFRAGGANGHIGGCQTLGSVGRSARTAHQDAPGFPTRR
jgi:hypothetical protein